MSAARPPSPAHPPTLLPISYACAALRLDPARPHCGPARLPADHMSPALRPGPVRPHAAAASSTGTPAGNVIGVSGGSTSFDGRNSTSSTYSGEQHILPRERRSGPTPHVRVERSGSATGLPWRRRPILALRCADCTRGRWTTERRGRLPRRDGNEEEEGGEKHAEGEQKRAWQSRSRTSWKREERR